MASWQPSPDTTLYLLNVLKQTLNPDNNVQIQIRNTLDGFKTNPEYNYYLLHIFIFERSQNEYIRRQAGLFLKNNINFHFSRITDNEMKFIMEKIIQGVNDPSSTIRKDTANIITTLIKVRSIRACRGITHFLLECLRTTDDNAIHGALLALMFICQDHCEELDSDYEGNSTTYMLPRFLEFFRHSNAEFRELAVSCVLEFIYYYPAVMSQMKDQFISGYLHLCSDQSIRIRERVVLIFTHMVEKHSDHIQPHLPQILEFVLQSMQDTHHETLAIKATEFWGFFSHDKVCKTILPQLLPTLLQVLMKNMKYSDDELRELGFFDHPANDHLPDKDKDINPKGNVSNHSKKDEEDDEEVHLDWNLRKGSAEALDYLARAVGDSILSTLLPIFNQGLHHQDWKVQESTLLGLGCISIGCPDMKMYLPSLIPFLFHHLQNPIPLLRSITCWTLGRYTSWVRGHKEHFNNMVNGFMALMKDRNKKVQCSAMRSIIVISKEASKEIVPYIEPLMVNFNECFKFYQKKSLLTLFDTISEFTHYLISKIPMNRYMELLLQPILAIWQNLSDRDHDLFRVLECLGYIAADLGKHFKPYFQPLFDRSLRLIRDVLVAKSRNEHYDIEFLLCSIDLLSQLCNSLGRDISPAISNSNLLSYLSEMCSMDNPQVLQGCYALIGDIAVYSPNTVQGVGHQIIPLLLNGITEEYDDLTNNAIWAIGKLIKISTASVIEPLQDKIFDRIMWMFEQGFSIETCVVSLGILSSVCPENLMRILEQQMKIICKTIKVVYDEDDRIDAMRGVCTAILKNPRVLLPNFSYFCEVIPLINAHQDCIQTVLDYFKKNIDPNEWNRQIDFLPPPVKKVLREKYKC